jgi:hypothetical protein
MVRLVLGGFAEIAFSVFLMGWNLISATAVVAVCQ